MFIRYLTDEERERYFKAYMETEGYKSDWLQDHLCYELHNDTDNMPGYTNIRIYKQTKTGRRANVYNAYHKCMEKYRLEA